MRIIFLCLFICSIAAQVSHQPIVPSISNVKFGLSTRTVPQKTAFKQQFPSMGYDIGGAIYQTRGGLLNQQLFDPVYYHPSSSCQLYRSELSLAVQQSIDLSKDQTIQSMTVSDQLSSIYAIISDQSYADDQTKIKRVLRGYSFNNSGFSQIQQSVQVSQLGLNADEKVQIRVVVVGEYVIVYDGVKMVAVDPKNMHNHWNVEVTGDKSATYEELGQHELIGFKLCRYSKSTGKGMVMAVWDHVIKGYEIVDKASRATVTADLQPPTDTFFTDAICDNSKYYALAGPSLVLFHPQPQSPSKHTITLLQLQSKQCTSLHKYQSTLHIICQQGGNNYVAQLYLNQSSNTTTTTTTLSLNRYYTQIDDAKFLFRFGGDYNPKLIISGDNQLMMVPYAVNRMALLQSNYQYRNTRIRALGVQEIYSLRSWSNFSHTYAIGIGRTFLSLFVIQQQPPQMQCWLVRGNQQPRINILVQLNTSSCIANGDWQQLQSICTYHIPFNLYPSLVEVDAANHLTIVVTIVLLLVALGIVVVACGLYCRTQVSQAVNQVRKKINEIKRKQKATRPI